MDSHLTLWACAAMAWLVVVPMLPVKSPAWARDRWLLGLAGVGLLFLYRVEPALAAIGLAAVLQWRGPAQLPGLVVYGAIIGTWLVVAALPPDAIRLLPFGFALIGLYHSTHPLYQAETGLPILGALGHRTLSAALLAMLLPFCWPWLVLPLGLALVVEQSWLAWIAGAVAVSLMEPWTAPAFVVAGAVLAVPIITVARMPRERIRTPAENTWLDRLSARGTSIDSLRARLVAWKALVARLSFFGAGPHSAPRLMLRGGADYGGHAHCEPLEYLVEYGVAGALALVLVVVRVAPHLHAHDAWSAAVLAGAVLMLGTYPARIPQVGGLWWACCAVVATR